MRTAVAYGCVIFILLLVILGAAIMLGEWIESPGEVPPDHDDEHGAHERGRDAPDDQAIGGADDTLP